jgi:hypothetical protein
MSTDCRTIKDNESAKGKKKQKTTLRLYLDSNPNPCKRKSMVGANFFGVLIQLSHSAGLVCVPGGNGWLAKRDYIDTCCKAAPSKNNTTCLIKAIG